MYQTLSDKELIETKLSCSESREVLWCLYLSDHRIFKMLMKTHFEIDTDKASITRIQFMSDWAEIRRGRYWLHRRDAMDKQRATMCCVNTRNILSSHPKIKAEAVSRRTITWDTWMWDIVRKSRLCFSGSTSLLCMKITIGLKWSFTRQLKCSW